jgi:hypothetical protein
MKYGTQNIGGFFIINTISHRIIKEHKHMRTALSHWKKLGREGYVIKPVADREAFYAELRASGQAVPLRSQTS